MHSDPRSAALSIYRAYHAGKLGLIKSLEEVPNDSDVGQSLSFITLPMALNYRRSSPALWASATASWNDPYCAWIFDTERAASAHFDDLQAGLLRHRVALQPNRHTANWQTISRTVVEKWGSLSNLFISVGGDYQTLKLIVQLQHKRGFPYLSGQKLFNYWCAVLHRENLAKFDSPELIDIAVDAHIRNATYRIGLLKEDETPSQETIAAAWRELLRGSQLIPVDMNEPLWRWSRAGFPELI